MATLIYGGPPADTRIDLNLDQAAPFGADRADCLDVAMVNNMRDGARRATERQYLRLLTSASDGLLVRIKFYTLSDIPKNDEPGGVQYQDVAALWEDHPDAVIVTGTEPKLADLTQEPYWPKLIRTVDWCQDNVSSTIWSCLAAHAAVLHLDGIKRQPLEQKCFGIFPCERSARHPLLEGLAFPSLVQHSRWNALDPAQLRRAGYTVLTFSGSVGADIFVRKDKCLSVFFQGHPEYAEDTLLREYRRDVGRYLNRESDRYPALPEGCIGESDTAALLAFRDRALAERRPNSIADLPLPNAPAIPRQFHTQARRLYRNWLTILANQKASRPAFIEPRAPNAISRHSI